MKVMDKQIEEARQALKQEFESLTDKNLITKSSVLRALFDGIKLVAQDERAAYGQAINSLKNEVQEWLDQSEAHVEVLKPIDVTAPWDVNTPSEKRPRLLPAEQGSIHPLRIEIERICDIYQRMGFVVEESREIDDDYHMFSSLNFPEGHPARDDYDTFMTDEGLIAPAHTSTMQNRIMRKYAANLEKGEPIAVVVPDRVFRNEDIDATHEHTFYQIEGVYVGKGVTVGNLIATLSAFMNEYFGQDLKTKLQPFYFPFTEPSFEFAIERPDVLRKDDSEEQKWLELLGCGMIHPNVMREAGIDPTVYTGFAWGNGIERLVMLRNQIEDIRHFESANLKFLRQF
jgi:phenylalanyl-tRNA synthetase alpha chain